MLPGLPLVEELVRQCCSACVRGEEAMKIKLIVRKKKTVLYENTHEIIDAESFGAAFAAVWVEMKDRRLQRTTSIGELMEVLNNEALEELSGAEIYFEKA
jgi:hypothetical protein